LARWDRSQQFAQRRKSGRRYSLVPSRRITETLSVVRQTPAAKVDHSYLATDSAYISEVSADARHHADTLPRRLHARRQRTSCSSAKR
jgi:hypothetical protein